MKYPIILTVTLLDIAAEIHEITGEIIKHWSSELADYLPDHDWRFLA